MTTTGVPPAPPRTSDEAAQHIEQFTRDIVREALTVQALVDTLKGAKKFIEQAARAYAERFLLELVQNAYDAQPAGSPGQVLVLFDAAEGDFGCVYVANTGVPFTADNFRAICEIAQSSKRPGEGIGNKGVGFKSVLQVAAWPEIYSTSGEGGAFDGYCFRFAEPSDMRRLTASEEEAAKLADRISPYGLPVHIPPALVSERLAEMARDGYASVVRLPLRTEGAAAIARRQLDEVLSADAPLLLFLDRLKALRVEILEPDGSRLVHDLGRTPEPLSLAVDGIEGTEVGLGHVVRRILPGTEAHDAEAAHGARYLVLSRLLDREAFLSAIRDTIAANLADEAWAEWEGDAAVTVAVRLGASAGGDNRLYCYLPMGASATGPMLGHINAPFAVTLARDALVPGARLNEFLLDVAADIVAETCIPLRSHPHARTSLVDLAVWDTAHGARLASAFKRAGRDVTTAAILPVLGDKRWSSLAAAYSWRRAMRTLTPDRIAATGQASLLDPSLEALRLDRIEALAGAVVPRKMAPRLDHLAAWAEAVAQQMGADARRRPAAFDPAPWVDLYDDLAEVFDRGDSAALRGRELLIDDNLRLHRTWGGVGTDKSTAIFFPMREVPDGEDASVDVSIPKTLGRHLAYLHADLQWRVMNPATRRLENRPGREFLDRTGLVRMPRTQSILERLGAVLGSTVNKQVHADALRLVFNLTATRPYTQSPKVSELHLRVPTADGRWVPAERTVFSAWWPGTLGDHLERLILESGGASPDIEAIGARLLGRPDAFGFRLESLPAWVAFLRRVGVADGLQPIDVTPAVGDQNGWWWTDRFPAAVSLPAVDHARWDETVKQARHRPSYPNTLYRIVGAVQRLPASADLEVLPQQARETLGRLLVAGLASWGDDVLWVRIARPRSGNAADPVSLPSPAQAFLRGVAWLPVTRPGSAGEEDFARPSQAWHYRDTDNEARPTFMPLVVTPLRRQLEGSAGASDRLRLLGLNVWNDRADSIKRLRALARALEHDDVAETLLANFRKAYERTWTLVTRGVGPEPAGKIRAEDHLVVTRRGKLDAQAAGAEDVPYVLVDEDRLVAAILDTIEVPVLPVDPADGRAAASLIERGAGLAPRMVGGADIRVYVDGIEVAEHEGTRLIANGREWLVDLVALTLEFKASAFNRQSDQRIRSAIEALRSMLLHAGADVAIELAGEPVALPAHLRRAFAVAIPGRPGVAYVGEPDHLDWDTIAFLAPKIGELLGTVETANALESVAASLAHRLGGASSTAPTDADYSAVFEESADRVAQVRRAQRTGITGVAFSIRPVVIAITASDPVGELMRVASGEPDPETIVAALEPWADAFLNGVTPDSLVASALSGTGLAGLRDLAGIGFSDFNAVLASLGQGYEPITNPSGHVLAMASFLARHRDATVDRLRRLATGEFDAGRAPTMYAAMVAELGAAILRRSPDASTWVRPLDPDPAWLERYDIPPDELLSSRVDVWVASLADAANAADPAPLPDLPTARTANAKMLARLIETAAALLPIWAAKRGGVTPPAWLAEGDDVIREFTTKGLLDFRLLDDAAVISWLRRLGRWSDDLPESLDLDALGISDRDLAAQREEAERARWERALARRSVALDGKPVTLEPDRVADLVEALEGGLTDELLRTPERPVSLREIEQRRRKQRKDRDQGKKPKSKVPTRLTSDQTELIGFMGEFVANAWLQRRHGSGALWRSHYRRHVIHDGDLGNDDLGFDFEVLRDRRGALMFEVKATTTDDLAFDMSEAEIRVAQENAGNDRYRILFVGRVNDSEERWLAVLPNPLSAQGRGRYRIVGRGIRYEFDLPEGG